MILAIIIKERIVSGGIILLLLFLAEFGCSHHFLSKVLALKTISLSLFILLFCFWLLRFCLIKFFAKALGSCRTAATAI